MLSKIFASDKAIADAIKRPKNYLLHCAVLIFISINVFLAYGWLETYQYRDLEVKWKEVLKSYDAVISPLEVEQTIKRLNPNGYQGYGRYEDAVGPLYDFPMITHFRNDIRFRREFLKMNVDEINRKIAFIDKNMNTLSFWHKRYYVKLKQRINSVENGIISQNLLDMVLETNFDKKKIEQHRFKITKITFIKTGDSITDVISLNILPENQLP
jgi:hypothetical protein